MEASDTSYEYFPGNLNDIWFFSNPITAALWAWFKSINIRLPHFTSFSHTLALYYKVSKSVVRRDTVHLHPGAGSLHLTEILAFVALRHVFSVHVDKLRHGIAGI